MLLPDFAVVRPVYRPLRQLLPEVVPLNPFVSPRHGVERRLLAWLGPNLIGKQLNLLLEVVEVVRGRTGILTLLILLLLVIVLHLALGSRLRFQDVLFQLRIDYLLKLVDNQLLFAFDGDAPELFNIALLNIGQHGFIKHFLWHKRQRV